MSYDLHGKWDLGNDWLDPVLNSHTNLTEITNALDLIWRNNVPSDKVVLGLAFYARVFSAADPSCMEKDSLEVKKTYLQCWWTNCFEDYPTGWTRVPRTGHGARTDEKMWDNTGCGGEGQHTFCCPPDSELTKCGWYTHNNGNCDSQCPSGFVEVGSNFQHCSNNKNDYQAACCTTDTDSMKLYSQCDWAGDAPDCDEGECASGHSLLVSSSTGSGGNYCDKTT